TARSSRPRMAPPSSSSSRTRPSSSGASPSADLSMATPSSRAESQRATQSSPKDSSASPTAPRSRSRARRPPKAETDEPLGTLHPPPGHDHSGHARLLRLRELRLPAPPRQRPAQRGLPDDPGQRHAPRLQLRDYGLLRRHAPGARVLDDRRRGHHELGQPPG